jgi:hypothetical protein
MEVEIKDQNAEQIVFGSGSLPDSEFSLAYLRRFLQFPSFSEAVSKFLTEQFVALIQFNGKVTQDVKFAKLFLITQLHITYFVTDLTPDDRMVQLLFGLLLMTSCANLMRFRGVPFHDLRAPLLKTFTAFVLQFCPEPLSTLPFHDLRALIFLPFPVVLSKFKTAG